MLPVPEQERAVTSWHFSKYLFQSFPPDRAEARNLFAEEQEKVSELKQILERIKGRTRRPV